MTPAPAMITGTGFEIEDRNARGLLRDLHTPRPSVYWLDLLLTCAVGWTGFVLAVSLPFAAARAIGCAVAVLTLYRGLCFLHEISHIRRGGLGAFEPVWNALIGLPLLMPSFIYTGVHQSHHSLASYGTGRDPEYLPFGHSRRLTIMFAVQSFLIPAALLVRFLMLAPVGLLVPRFHQWLVIHASALTMNFGYEREATPELSARIRRDSLIILAVWGLAIALLPFRVFLIWFAVVSLISFINTLRTLAAHRYEGNGDTFDRKGQLRDSVDVPGGVWTALWAPVGLRYHALHHYFPGIPYHNLPEAHRRLKNALAADSCYCRATRTSLRVSLLSLLRLDR